MELKHHFLGANIKYFREHAGLNKEKLAEVIGTSGTQIGLLERDEISNPGYFLIESIADYFGVEIRSLVRTDLRNTDHTQLTFSRAARNLGALSSVELRTLLKGIDDLIELEVEKGFFRTVHRQIPGKKRQSRQDARC